MSTDTKQNKPAKPTKEVKVSEVIANSVNIAHFPQTPTPIQLGGALAGASALAECAVGDLVVLGLPQSLQKRDKSGNYDAYPIIIYRNGKVIIDKMCLSNSLKVENPQAGKIYQIKERLHEAGDPKLRNDRRATAEEIYGKTLITLV